jgi:hypothetical protein
MRIITCAVTNIANTGPREQVQGAGILTNGMSVWPESRRDKNSERNTVLHAWYELRLKEQLSIDSIPFEVRAGAEEKVQNRACNTTQRNQTAALG